MTLEDRAERLRERRNVQSPAQSMRLVDVVEGVPGLQLFQEPEAKLGKGEPGAPAPPRRGQWRSERVRGHVSGGFDPAGELCHRGALKESPHRKLHPQRVTDARDRPHGHQRVSAELEEIVLDADIGQPQ